MQINKHKLGIEIRNTIFSNFEDSDKVRASRFKKSVEKVLSNHKLNLKVVKLSTSWDMECDCGHSDCDQASLQRFLYIKFESQVSLKVLI